MLMGVERKDQAHHRRQRPDEGSNTEDFPLETHAVGREYIY